MQLSLTNQKKVKEVKEAFNRFFPYLKIEFFPGKHSVGSSSFLDERASPNTCLGTITRAMKEGIITIRPEDTVASVEQRFQREFGLPVQVFRQTKDIWIETSDTDTMTLAEQNDMGRSDSQFFKLKSYRYTMLL